MRRALMNLTLLLALTCLGPALADAQQRGQERERRRPHVDSQTVEPRADEGRRRVGDRQAGGRRRGESQDQSQSQNQDQDQAKIQDQGEARHQQEKGLAQAASDVREAWLTHDAGRIVANSPQVVVQLPGADPSAAVSSRQAAALLADFFGEAREVEVVVRSAREVEAGQGYVELTRRYRIEGTQDTRAQSVFLSFRRAGERWLLVELKAIEP